MNSDNKNTFKYLALITQVGINSITPIVLGLFVGSKIDKWLKTRGVFSITFLVLGAMTSIYNIYKLVDFNKRSK